MIPTSRFKLLMLVSLAVVPMDAWAQNVGGAVPPYQVPPPVVAPQRSEPNNGFPTTPVQRENPFRAQEDLVQSFAASYQHAKKPRLALYWNRELADTLNDWYSPARIVVTDTGSGNLNGTVDGKPLSVQGSGTSQKTIEAQVRAPDPNAKRLHPSEGWEWEFQDGFLAPFLKAGATVVDRTAITRLTGANNPGNDGSTIEMKALQGMADLMIEVLVTPRGESTTGYELRARVLDVKTGAILSYVNSKGLKEWNPPKQPIATNHGFELPDEDDEDDGFGPQSANTRYKATPNGFERTRKPPRLADISRNLAYNVMNSLVAQWH